MLVRTGLRVRRVRVPMKTWSVQYEDGERRECRSLRVLLWSVYCPRWYRRRVLNAIEDFRFRLPCLLHGHNWHYFDSHPEWDDARECEHCGEYEVLR